MTYLATTEEKQAKLDELRTVYDAAVSGQMEITINDPAGGSVTYRNPDIANLRQRISELSRELGDTANRRRRVPIGF